MVSKSQIYYIWKKDLSGHYLSTHWQFSVYIPCKWTKIVYEILCCILVYFKCVFCWTPVLRNVILYNNIMKSVYEMQYKENIKRRTATFILSSTLKWHWRKWINRIGMMYKLRWFFQCDRNKQILIRTVGLQHRKRWCMKRKSA